jgi:hypothetical protein
LGQSSEQTKPTLGRQLNAQEEHPIQEAAALHLHRRPTERPVEHLHNDLRNVRRLYNHLKVRYDYIVNNFITPFPANKELPYSDKVPESLDAVMRPMLQDACEAQTLREQMGTLQLQLFANVQKVQATSDDQLAQGFRNLASSIKTLTRGVQLNDSEGLIRVCEGFVLTQNVDESVWGNRARKKLLLEATIWSISISAIFQSPFRVFGDRGSMLDSLWEEMFGAEHFSYWPKPTALSEK